MTVVYPFLLNQACNSGTTSRLEPCRHGAGDHWAERLWGESDGVTNDVMEDHNKRIHGVLRTVSWVLLYIMNSTTSLLDTKKYQKSGLLILMIPIGFVWIEQLQKCRKNL